MSRALEEGTVEGIGECVFVNVFSEGSGMSQCECGNGSVSHV